MSERANAASFIDVRRYAERLRIAHRRTSDRTRQATVTADCLDDPCRACGGYACLAGFERSWRESFRRFGSRLQSGLPDGDRAKAWFCSCPNFPGHARLSRGFLLACRPTMISIILYQVRLRQHDCSIIFKRIGEMAEKESPTWRRTPSVQGASNHQAPRDRPKRSPSSVPRVLVERLDAKSDSKRAGTARKRLRMPSASFWVPLKHSTKG